MSPAAPMNAQDVRRILPVVDLYAGRRGDGQAQLRNASDRIGRNRQNRLGQHLGCRRVSTRDENRGNGNCDCGSGRREAHVGETGGGSEHACTGRDGCCIVRRGLPLTVNSARQLSVRHVGKRTTTLGQCSPQATRAPSESAPESHHSGLVARAVPPARCCSSPPSAS